jgi:Protein of unknown function (DUF992)
MECPSRAFAYVAERSVAMRYATLICASFIGLMTATAVSAEKPRVNLGVLTCTLIKPAQDAAQKLMCGFKPAGTGGEEKYSGSIRESGQELPSGKVVLIWTVLGPAEGKIRVGILAQRYVKGIGAPGQTPMLVGETNPAIVLQFETNNGAATYDTITIMELELTGIPA